ncbi:phenylalanine--tRNA ligase beta subunit, cytoplasmic [Tanacetum coccineum]
MLKCKDGKSTAFIIGNHGSSYSKVTHSSQIDGILETVAHNKDHSKPIKFSYDSKGHYENFGVKLKILNLVISKGYPNKVALTGYTEVLTWILFSYRKCFTMFNRKEGKSTAFIIGNLGFSDFKGKNVYVDNIDVDVTEDLLRENFNHCGTIT